MASTQFNEIIWWITNVAERLGPIDCEMTVKVESPIPQLFMEWISDKTVPFKDSLIDIGADVLVIDAVEWITQMRREPLMDSSLGWRWWLEHTTRAHENDHSNLPYRIIDRSSIRFDSMKDAYLWLIKAYVCLNPKDRANIQDWDDIP